MVQTYIIENVEALWPKLDRTYVFDQKVKRSMPCDPRDQNAEFSCGSFYAYDFNGKQNVSLRLKGVQVIKYVPREASNPFDTVDGGFVLEDANPFATKPKSNNVLEQKTVAVDDDDDDFDEAPVKRTATKAAPAPSDNDELDTLVDNWDD